MSETDSMTSLIVDKPLCAACVSVGAEVAIPIARAVLTSLAKSGHVVSEARLCRGCGLVGETFTLAARK